MGSCIVVGAGPGLGASIANRFAREGFHVAITSRSRSAGLTESNSMKWFRADAGSSGSLKSAISAAVAWGGGAEVLIYNAAELSPSPVLELDAEQLLSDLAVNVTGAATAVQSVLPHLRAKGVGTILFTGGGLAHRPHPQWSSLGASKAALLNYSQSLRRALEGSNIRVATVTICGLIERGGAFDPDRIAEVYWSAHNGPEPAAEILFEPEGSDPFYNDRTARIGVLASPAE